jgi:hypothetical protein
VAALALSLDSLIAGFGLSASLSRRRAALLALCFGACDGLASLAAPFPAFVSIGLDTFAAVLLLAWAAFTLSQLWWMAAVQPPQWAAFCLPPLLCLDNLLFPANALATGFASFACAGLGLIAGQLIATRISRHVPGAMVKNALLATAGVGLLLT